MKRRKLAAMCLTVVMVASFVAGCGGAGSAPESNSLTDGTATEDSKAADEAGSTKGAENSKETEGEVVNLELGACQQPDHISSKAADELAARVKEATDGAVNITCYHAETLGNNSELAAGCAAGTVDIYFSAMSQYGTYCPQETVLDAFFMFKDWDHLQRYMETDNYEGIISAVEKATTTHVLGSMYYATRGIYTKGKQVNTVDDLKGLKLRVPNEPMPVACIEAMGASATPVNYSEVYMALQNGTVDGGEGGPSSLIAMKFYEVADQMTLTNHQVQTLTFFMSDKARNELTEEQYEIVNSICQEVCEEYSAIAVEQEQKDIETLKEYMTITENPEPDSFVEACQGVWKEQEGAWGKGIWEDIQSIRDK